MEQSRSSDFLTHNSLVSILDIMFYFSGWKTLQIGFLAPKNVLDFSLAISR